MRRAAALGILAQVLVSIALPAQDAAPGLRTPAPPAGLYLGSWDDQYRPHWVVLFIDDRGRAVSYDPPNILGLCALAVDGDRVTFRTGLMTEWSSGMQFTLAFGGVLSGGDISGTVHRAGRNIDTLTASLRLVRYSIDSSASRPDGGLSGLYSALQGNQETGDVEGDELLLVNTTRGLVALWTDYEGAPDGPYAADSVAVRGQTVRIVLNAYGLYTQRPLRPLVQTFTLATAAATTRRHEDPQLVKRATLAELLRLPMTSSTRRPRCD
jgi:hypothetical protein